MKMLARRLILLMLLVFCGGAWAAEVAGNIVFSAGTVVIEGVDGVSRSAVRGGELRSGEVISTGSDGRAQIRFRDGASMSFQPKSRFRVDEYRFSDGGSREERGFFSLLQGGFRTVSGLLGKQFREQYRVQTSVATIGIRGTSYVANLGDDGLRVSTIQGLVEVCNDGGCLQIAPGESGLAGTRDRKPLRIQEAAVEDKLRSPDAPPPPVTTSITTPDTVAAPKAPPPPPMDEGYRGAGPYGAPKGR